MWVPASRQQIKARRNDATFLTAIAGSDSLRSPNTEMRLPERRRFGGLFFCRVLLLWSSVALRSPVG